MKRLLLAGVIAGSTGLSAQAAAPVDICDGSGGTPLFTPKNMFDRMVASQKPIDDGARDDRWLLLLRDANGDGEDDLHVVSRYGNDTPNVEVYVMDGATRGAADGARFGTRFLHCYSAGLGSVKGNDAWDFRFGDYNRDGSLDLYAFEKLATANTQYKLHVYDGVTGYASRILDVVLPVPVTNVYGRLIFDVRDTDGDGKEDIHFVSHDGAGNYEDYFLTGSSGYTAYITP